MPIAEKVKSLEELNSRVSENMNFLIYGNSGAGKSTWANSIGDYKEYSPVLFIDVEGTAGFLPKVKNKVDFIITRNWEELSETVEELKADVRAGNFNYKTLILDSITWTSDHLLEFIVKTRSKITDPEALKRAKTEFEDWNLYKKYLSDLMDFALKIPCHTILIGHSTIEVDKGDSDAGSMHDRLSITGRNTRDMIERRAEHIGHLKCITDRRILSFKSTMKSTSKTKLGNVRKEYQNEDAGIVFKEFQNTMQASRLASKKEEKNESEKVV